MAIDQREGVKEGVPGDGLIVGVGEGEMRASDEAGAESEEEEGASKKEGFCGWTIGKGSEVRRRGVVTPVGRRGVESNWVVGGGVGHGYLQR